LFGDQYGVFIPMLLEPAPLSFRRFYLRVKSGYCIEDGLIVNFGDGFKVWQGRPSYDKHYHSSP
jgi:hypothetical protein